MIELYKDGDHMAILTDAKDEREFMDQVSELLADVIGSDNGYLRVAGNEDFLYGLQEWLSGKDNTGYSGLSNDWEFQLGRWLPQIVDICCKYRGYKADVLERKVLIAGDSMLSDEPTHRLTSRAHTIIQESDEEQGESLKKKRKMGKEEK